MNMPEFDFDMMDSILGEIEEEKNPRGSVYESKKHILVVDDDRTILRLIKEILESDYKVTTLSSGKAALRFFNDRNADLILLDYEMGDMSGVDVFRALHENPRTRRIPVIFVTGINDNDKIMEALSLYPCAYLLKPISAARLREEVRKNLYRKRR